LAEPIQLCPVEDDRFVWGGPPSPIPLKRKKVTVSCDNRRSMGPPRDENGSDTDGYN
jgi:hypothetical protein